MPQISLQAMTPTGFCKDLSQSMRRGLLALMRLNLVRVVDPVQHWNAARIAMKAEGRQDAGLNVSSRTIDHCTARNPQKAKLRSPRSTRWFAAMRAIPGESVRISQKPFSVSRDASSSSGEATIGRPVARIARAIAFEWMRVMTPCPCQVFARGNA